MDWVTEIGPYRVEKHESPRPGGQAYMRLEANPSFCVHTTEGSTVDGAWATLNANGSAPHFIVGEDRIVQTRPLGAQGATLRNHNYRFIQVECVGSAKLAEHQLTPPTWKPLIELTEFVHVELEVPLHRPDGWTDKLSSGTWADNNTRRQSRKALSERGVYGHIEVPDQDPTWHWDPGSLDYSALFDAVRKSVEVSDVEFKAWHKGWTLHEQGDPEPTEKGWTKKGWLDRARAVKVVSVPTPVHDHFHTHNSGPAKPYVQ